MADAIKCDNCHEFEDRPGAWGGYQHRDGEKLWGPHNVPAGWVRLSARRHPYDPATVSDCEGEFCGWGCAAEWFAKYAEIARLRRLDEVEGAPDSDDQEART